MLVYKPEDPQTACSAAAENAGANDKNHNQPYLEISLSRMSAWFSPLLGDPIPRGLEEAGASSGSTGWGGMAGGSRPPGGV